jgi:hypothetical protein
VVGFQFTVTREEESTDMVVMLGVRGAVVSVDDVTTHTGALAGESLPALS